MMRSRSFAALALAVTALFGGVVPLAGTWAQEATPAGVEAAAPIKIALKIKESNGVALFQLDVTNVAATRTLLEFGTAQRYDFVVRETATGNVVWKWSEEESFLAEGQTKTLKEGETWSATEAWYYKEMPLGDYQAVAVITAKTPVESAPVACTFLLPVRLNLTVVEKNGAAELDLEAKNIDTEEFVLHFANEQKYDFVVREKATEQVIWQWSAGRTFTGAPTDPGLKPGEALTFHEIWAWQGPTAPPVGSYTIEAVLATVPPIHSQPQDLPFLSPAGDKVSHAGEHEDGASEDPATDVHLSGDAISDGGASGASGDSDADADATGETGEGDAPGGEAVTVGTDGGSEGGGSSGGGGTDGADVGIELGRDESDKPGSSGDDAGTTGSGSSSGSSSGTSGSGASGASSSGDSDGSGADIDEMASGGDEDVDVFVGADEDAGGAGGSGGSGDSGSTAGGSEGSSAGAGTGDTEPGFSEDADFDPMTGFDEATGAGAAEEPTETPGDTGTAEEDIFGDSGATETVDGAGSSAGTDGSDTTDGPMIGDGGVDLPTGTDGGKKDKFLEVLDRVLVYGEKILDILKLGREYYELFKDVFFPGKDGATTGIATGDGLSGEGSGTLGDGAGLGEGIEDSSVSGALGAIGEKILGGK